MSFLRRVIRHFAWMRLLPAVLQPPHRRSVVLLGLLAVVEALFAALAIGSIIPVVALLADPIAVERNSAVIWIADATGLSARADLLYAASGLLAGVYTIRFALRVVSQHLRIRFQESVRADVARRLLAEFLDRPYTFHLNASSPELVAIVTQDSVAIAHLAAHSIGSFSTVASVLMVLGALLVIDPLITLVALLAIGGIAVATYGLQHRRAGALGRKMRRATVRVPHHAMQVLGSIRETRLMRIGNDQLDAFSADLAAIGRMQAKLLTFQRVPGYAVEWLVFVGIAATLALLGADATLATTVMPTLAAFFFAAIRLVPQAMAGVSKIVGAQTLRPSLEAVHALLVAERPPAPAERDRVEIEFQHEVAFRNVDVEYDSAKVPALRGASLTIPRGAHVGIAGPSGAGKTTLVNALLGFLPPSAGEITVDGQSIHEGLTSWQRRIGLVPQDPFLLDDTILANISFGRHFPDEAQRLAAVLATVRLDAFVAALPDGLHTAIGERGTRVSGGQRQRIAIARALYGDPEVVVLDEATSQLDPEVAAAIDDAIAALAGRKTLIIVAHRLVSMARCDIVIYMDGGRVVETGRLDELAARNAAFARFTGEQPRVAVVGQ